MLRPWAVRPAWRWEPPSRKLWAEMKPQRWGLACVLSSLSFLYACSSGKQVLASEGDTYVPWHGGPAYFAKWPKGLSSDPNFFHLSVWLQNPMNASRFQGAGINLFTGLWKGPTDDQMAALTMADMPVICDQTTAYVNNPTIESLARTRRPRQRSRADAGQRQLRPVHRAELNRGQICTDGDDRSFAAYLLEPGPRGCRE